MAVCRIIDTGATPEQYEQVRSRLGLHENSAPPGTQVHLAARREDGTIRVIEVWETREQAEAWGEQVRAVRQELGIGDATPPPMTYYDVHRTVVVAEVPAGPRPIEGVGTSTAG